MLYSAAATTINKSIILLILLIGYEEMDLQKINHKLLKYNKRRNSLNFKYIYGRPLYKLSKRMLIFDFD